MEFDQTCRYQESHEWIRIEGDDYSENMTLAAIYAHLQTLTDALGVDWSVTTDVDPDA